MVNISWITEQIAVSGAFFDDDIGFLRRRGVDAIIDLRSEYCDNQEQIEKCGMQFLHIEVDDCDSPTKRQLEEIFKFVEPLLNKGKKVLIHCQNGCGRSPLVAVAIISKRGMLIPEAVSLVKEKNPWTGFTEHQEKFIYTELNDLSQ